MKLEHKIPPVLVVAIVSALMFATNQIFTHLRIEFQFRLEALTLLITFGIALATAGVASFKIHKTTVNPLNTENVSSLVTSGIYRYSRNPMYVGMLICLIGVFVFIANPINAPYPALFVWYMNTFQIKPEERVLSKVFSSDYDNYKARVRRWF
ncbi:methyltransferase family protein [Ningiella sp. W23]|uniref:methyltransferase family protein n=1 Tax=Ningiella sp. W23 TaxID=3023715 RepID=UPI00375718C7